MSPLQKLFTTTDTKDTKGKAFHIKIRCVLSDLCGERSFFSKATYSKEIE